MKLVTEFSNFTLNKGLAARTALSTEGKSPEEIEASLGETFKLEGDKLKFFVNALEVAGANTANLKRVFVATLTEGENVPPKATKVDDNYFIPEFLAAPKPAVDPKDAKGGRGGKRGGPGGPRGDKKGGGSPWGMSPEEIAAKKGKAAKPN